MVSPQRATGHEFHLVALLTFCWLGLTQALAAGSTSVSQPITVEDMVRFAKIGDPELLDFDWSDDYNPIATFSPDGKRVAVVVRRGNPERETNEASLLVFSTVDLLNDARPNVVAQFASAGSSQPIGRVRWLEDGRTLVFVGTSGEQNARVYRVDTETRELGELTSESARLMTYDITPSGERIVAIMEGPAVRPDQDPECLRRGCRVVAQELDLAQSGKAGGEGNVVSLEFSSGKRTFIPAMTGTDRDLEYCPNAIAGGISPDGRFALRLCSFKPERWPAWWLDYAAAPEVRHDLESGFGFRVRLMMVLDLQRGTSRRLNGAPWLGYQPDPIWVDGGRRVITVGSLEPLAGVDQKTRALRAATQAILLLDPATGEGERIVTLDAKQGRVSSAAWNEATQTLTVETSKDGVEQVSMTHKRTGRRWVTSVVTTVQPASSSAATNDRIELILEQSLNDRPVLVAVDRKTGARKRVLDPNPWLTQRKLSRVEAITWQSQGRTWRGGIYYPTNFISGKRYPVLLQTHGFNDRQFSLHGIARNFIAQPLAAHDVLVLQVEEKLRGATGPQEWPTVQAGYEAAIDRLDELGLIDRKRVGMVGWSRTGPHVGYTFTHSSYPIAAAAFTDIGSHGYWDYLSHLGSSYSRAMETDYGAAPFGEGLDTWRKLSPDFNFDRVRTPLFMWTAGSAAVNWDWYVGLRHFNVPVEYWVLPEGAHDVYKAGQRLRTNQLLVDWFRFWLKDEERTEPSAVNRETLESLKEQYARWRALREQKKAVLKQPPLS